MRHGQQFYFCSDLPFISMYRQNKAHLNLGQLIKTGKKKRTTNSMMQETGKGSGRHATSQKPCVLCARARKNLGESPSRPRRIGMPPPLFVTRMVEELNERTTRPFLEEEKSCKLCYTNTELLPCVLWLPLCRTRASELFQAPSFSRTDHQSGFVNLSLFLNYDPRCTARPVDTARKYQWNFTQQRTGKRLQMYSNNTKTLGLRHRPHMLMILDKQ